MRNGITEKVVCISDAYTNMKLKIFDEYFNIMDSLLHSMVEEDFKKLAYDFVGKECPSLPFQNWAEGDD